jgi:hypothetical protein
MCWQAGGTNKQADEEVACMLGMTIHSWISTDFYLTICCIFMLY